MPGDVTQTPSPVMQLKPWSHAKVGDYVGDQLGTYLVVARKLPQKWRAKNLAAQIPHSQVWIDTPSTWAVLLAIEEAAQCQCSKNPD